MIQVGGRRAQKAFLFALWVSSSSNAFRVLPRCPTAVHVSRARHPLSSTAAEAVSDPVQGLGIASEAEGSSRQLSKAVVVARGKARLFW